MKLSLEDVQNLFILFEFSYWFHFSIFFPLMHPSIPISSFLSFLYHYLCAFSLIISSIGLVISQHIECMQHTKSHNFLFVNELNKNKQTESNHKQQQRISPQLVSIKSFTKFKAFYIKFSDLKRLQRIYELREYCDGHLHQDHRMRTVLQNVGSFCFLKKNTHFMWFPFLSFSQCKMALYCGYRMSENSGNIQMTNTIYQEVLLQKGIFFNFLSKQFSGDQIFF